MNLALWIVSIVVVYVIIAGGVASFLIYLYDVKGWDDLHWQEKFISLAWIVSIPTIAIAALFFSMTGDIRRAIRGD